MPVQVVQFKHIGKVSFSRNQRSKNIKLSVKPDKSVLVSYPFYVSNKEALDFVMKNETWIRTQQEKIGAKKNQIRNGSEINTKLYKLIFVIGEKDRVSKKGKEITVSVTAFDSERSQAFIEHCLTEIYRFEAKQILPGRLAELAKQFGFIYNKVTIRNNRRNWGSCSSQNNISLNLQMMKLPNELIDYILLHELVHTEVKNHGPKFWEKLNSITDNRARALSAEVKKYSTYTL